MGLNGKYLGGTVNPLPSGAVIPTPITNSTVITMITNPASWDSDGVYTGFYTGLVAGNYYYDNTYNQKYEYDGTELRRTTYNTLV